MTRQPESSYQDQYSKYIDTIPSSNVDTHSDLQNGDYLPQTNPSYQQSDYSFDPQYSDPDIFSPEAQTYTNQPTSLQYGNSEFDDGSRYSSNSQWSPPPLRGLPPGPCTRDFEGNMFFPDLQTTLAPDGGYFWDIQSKIWVPNAGGTLQQYLQATYSPDKSHYWDLTSQSWVPTGGDLHDQFSSMALSEYDGPSQVTGRRPRGPGRGWHGKKKTRGKTNVKFDYEADTGMDKITNTASDTIHDIAIEKAVGGSELKKWTKSQSKSNARRKSLQKINDTYDLQYDPKKSGLPPTKATNRKARNIAKAKKAVKTRRR